MISNGAGQFDRLQSQKKGAIKTALTLRNATRRTLIAYAKIEEKMARAKQEKAPDFVKVLSTGRRGAGSRFAKVMDALQAPDAERGHMAAKGKELKRTARTLDEKLFAHPYFWSGFVYTGSAGDGC